MQWGSNHNYKTIINSFNYMKQNFTDKGFPVIISEVGMLNDYIKKNNSIEQFLYTLFSISIEYEGMKVFYLVYGIFPCYPLIIILFI